MKRAETYPKVPPKDMRAKCANCGQPWGFHGAVDARCPGTREAGVDIAAETFWKPTTLGKDTFQPKEN